MNCTCLVDTTIPCQWTQQCVTAQCTFLCGIHKIADTQLETSKLHTGHNSNASNFIETCNDQTTGTVNSSPTHRLPR